MASGYNITANISSYIQDIYEAAVLVARDNNFVTGLITTFFDAQNSATRDRSEYGTATFTQITDSDDLASQVFTPSVVNSLTPALFGAQFVITDRRIRNDPFAVRSDAARELGEAAAKHVQRNLMSDFTSLTGGTVGSAGGTLTWASLFKAIALLKQQNAPEPYYCVLQEGHWYHLGTAQLPGATVTNAPQLQDAIVRQGLVGYAFGAYLYTTNDITSGTAAVGAVFSREALAYDERLPFTIRPQRDESLGGGAWELNATMEYAHGVWRPKFGVQLIGTSVIS